MKTNTETLYFIINKIQQEKQKEVKKAKNDIDKMHTIGEVQGLLLVLKAIRDFENLKQNN